MFSRTLSLPYAAALAIPAVQAAAPYCLAGEPCFPGDAALATFNETVGGALIKVAVSAYTLIDSWEVRISLIRTGAFGVTTRIWLKSYPALPAINTVAGAVGCQDFESYSRLIKSVVDNTVALRDNGHFVSSLASQTAV